MASSEDMQALVAAQHAELTTACAAEADLDFAFRLQLQEALAASVDHLPPSSPARNVLLPPLPAPQEPDDPAFVLQLNALELERLRQECQDMERSKAEMRRVAEELRRCAHDQRFAREIADVPEDEWEEYGDNIEKPIAEEEDSEPFRLYVKGMPCEEVKHLSAVAVAVIDSLGKVVFKVQKPVLAVSTAKQVLEASALVDGLNAVLSLGIGRVVVHTDSIVLFKQVTGRWTPRQPKVVKVIDQVLLLQRKLEYCDIKLLPRTQMQFIIKLAREVIESQVAKGIDLKTNQNLKETCVICFEEIELSRMFVVDGCKHRFCFSCMKQHVEVKLLHGILPGCPHDGCKSMLKVESSMKFLPPKLLDIMSQRTMEASIPAEDKVYCPYPNCSALMSKSQTVRPDVGSSSSRYAIDTWGLRQCIKCSRHFCISCKVPWHNGLSCYEYKRRNPYPRPEDAKFQSLARHRLWRQCVKCNQMIELSEGCYHMTCRCGHQFCYTCGAPWLNKKATCNCPLFDLQFIIRDVQQGHDFEDQFSDEEAAF